MAEPAEMMPLFSLHKHNKKVRQSNTNTQTKSVDSSLNTSLFKLKLSNYLEKIPPPSGCGAAPTNVRQRCKQLQFECNVRGSSDKQ